MNPDWSRKATAEAYDLYARSFGLYAETSHDLIRLAGIEPGMAVVDLGAGTGATTQAILRVLGETGRVHVVDGSKAMLAVARRRLRSSKNVAFVRSAAERLHRAVPGPVHAVVCNSAFWLMHPGRTLGAIARVLGAGGRFGFNLGGPFFRFEDGPGGCGGGGPPAGESARIPDLRALDRLMTETARRLHGYAPRGAPRRWRPRAKPLNLGEWEALLREHGFEIAHHEVVVYRQTARSLHEWLRIPIYARKLLPGLSYDRKMAVLDDTFYRVVKRGGSYESRWIHFVVRPLA